MIHHRILVIPCAGKQTRFPEDYPKCLTRLPTGESSLGRILRQAKGLFDQVIIVCNLDNKMTIKRHVETQVDETYHPENLLFAIQPQPQGDSHAVYVATTYIPSALHRDTDFVVIWGDHYSVERATLKTLIETYPSRAVGLIFPTAQRRRPYTIVVRDLDTNHFVAIEPAAAFHAECESAESDCGVFMFHLTAFTGAWKRADNPRVPFLDLISKYFQAVDADEIASEAETYGLNDLEDLVFMESQ